MIKKMKKTLENMTKADYTRAVIGDGMASELIKNLTGTEYNRVFLEVYANQCAPDLGKDLRKIMKDYFHERYTDDYEGIRPIEQSVMKEIGNQQDKVYFIIHSALTLDYVLQVMYIEEKLKEKYPKVSISQRIATRQCGDYCAFISGGCDEKLC